MIETPQERATAGMLEKAEAALRTLLDKMERIEASEAYRSVWIVAQIHSGPYHGENWAVERNAARAALRDTAPSDYERFKASSPENAALLDAEERVLAAEQRAAEAEAALTQIAAWSWDSGSTPAPEVVSRIYCEARAALRDTAPAKEEKP